MRSEQRRLRGRALGWCLGALLPGLAGAAPAVATANVNANTNANAAVAADRADWAYVVQPGDTLVDIGARHLAPAFAWQRLARHNRLADPAHLRPGSRLRIPLAWLRHDPTGAEVLHLRGEVQRLNGAQAWPLAQGDRLQPGEQVETGPQGTVTLRFVDGSRLLLTPGSRLRIDSAGQHADSRSVETRVRVDTGSAETRVDPGARARRRFEISTPIVNLGVRGTEFRTHAGAQDTHVEVLAGRVAAGDAVSIDRGFGIVAKPGVPVSPPLRLAAAPDLSAVAPRLEQVPLRLQWDPVPGVQGYRAQIWADDAQGALLLDGRFVEPVATWPQLPDGRYRLRVRVIDDQGLEGLDAQVPLVLITQPLPPPPLQPAPGARERQRNVTLRWAPVPGSAGYRLQLAGPAGFALPQTDLTLGPLASTTLALAPGAYQWRLASLGATGERGPFGPARPFTVQPPPPAPVADAPQRRGGEVAWSWRPTGPDDRYELQVAHEASFADPLLALAVTGPQVLLPLREPGRFALRVRALGTDGLVGPYSAVQWIDVAPPAFWPGLVGRVLP